MKMINCADISSKLQNLRTVFFPGEEKRLLMEKRGWGGGEQLLAVGGHRSAI